MEMNLRVSSTPNEQVPSIQNGQNSSPSTSFQCSPSHTFMSPISSQNITFQCSFPSFPYGNVNYSRQDVAWQDWGREHSTYSGFTPGPMYSPVPTQL